jgi:2-polyprenyl-3-methyl-5-hydroxy-6-metoxy-1,4-benzoquinol methylase
MSKLLAFVFAALVLTPVLPAQNESTEARPHLDVPYVPTPPDVVAAMLTLANVHKGDILYDLGCGDGRIVVAAVKQYGARATGIDIDPERLKEARENAQKEGVAEQAKFRQEDLFTTDFHDADVVTLYLLPSVNMKLRPKLQRLKPGTRIVSHSFDMEDWKPDKTVDVNGRLIYLWVIPAKAAQ